MSPFHSTLSNILTDLANSDTTRFDLRNEDLQDLPQVLEQGNGGSIKKVEHIPTGTIMAKKVCGSNDFTFESVTECICTLPLGSLHRFKAFSAQANPARTANYA
jgi:hypothetical protein